MESNVNDKALDLFSVINESNLSNGNNSLVLKYKMISKKSFDEEHAEAYEKAKAILDERNALYEKYIKPIDDKLYSAQRALIEDLRNCKGVKYFKNNYNNTYSVVEDILWRQGAGTLAYCAEYFKTHFKVDHACAYGTQCHIDIYTVVNSIEITKEEYEEAKRTYVTPYMTWEIFAKDYLRRNSEIVNTEETPSDSTTKAYVDQLMKSLGASLYERSNTYAHLYHMRKHDVVSMVEEGKRTFEAEYKHKQ